MIGTVNGFSQTTSLRTRTFRASTDTLILDSLSIYPNSVQVYCGTEMLSFNSYYLDYSKARFALTTPCGDSIRIIFRVLPMNLAKVYGSRDTSIIYNQEKGDREKYLITTQYDVSDVFGGSSISKY